MFADCMYYLFLKAPSLTVDEVFALDTIVTKISLGSVKLLILDTRNALQNEPVETPIVLPMRTENATTVCSITPYC